MTDNPHPMPCAWCGGPCDVRPVQMEASCWECWYRNVGAPMAVTVYKRQPWWRRRSTRWIGPLNFERGGFA